MNPARRGDVSLGMRRILLLVPALVVLLVAPPAAAGGSWLEPDREWYEPGDSAVLRGHVGRGQLGWLEDGPFLAYLVVDPDDPRRAPTWPARAPSDIDLGPLTIVETGTDGWTALEVSIALTVPVDIEPGWYQVQYCNDPCTTGLGDLIGGQLWIGMPPPPETTETVPPPSSTTTDATTTTSIELIGGTEPARDDEPPGAIGWLVVGGSVVLLVAALGWRRHRYYSAATATAGRLPKPSRLGEPWSTASPNANTLPSRVCTQ